MSEGYTEDLRVNKYELVELFETHQDRFMKWGEAYVESTRERDIVKSQMDLAKAEAKDELEYVRAGRDLEVLTNYEKYGFKKSPSDKLREVWVIRSKEYQDALIEYRNVVNEFNNKLIEAEHSVSILKTAKEAFEHRKVSMDNLVKLLVNGFYSAKLPSDLREDVQAQRDQKLEERSREKTNETVARRRARRSE